MNFSPVRAPRGCLKGIRRSIQIARRLPGPLHLGYSWADLRAAIDSLMLQGMIVSELEASSATFLFLSFQIPHMSSPESLPSVEEARSLVCELCRHFYSQVFGAMADCTPTSRYNTNILVAAGLGVGYRRRNFCAEFWRRVYRTVRGAKRANATSRDLCTLPEFWRPSCNARYL